MVEEESGEEEDKEDDEGTADERDIWQVTNVTEEDVETTEGESVDFLVDLLDLVRWRIESRPALGQNTSWVIVGYSRWRFIRTRSLVNCLSFLRNERVVPDGFKSLYESFRTVETESKGVEQGTRSKTGEGRVTHHLGRPTHTRDKRSVTIPTVSVKPSSCVLDFTGHSVVVLFSSTHKHTDRHTLSLTHTLLVCVFFFLSWSMYLKVCVWKKNSSSHFWKREFLSSKTPRRSFFCFTEVSMKNTMPSRWLLENTRLALSQPNYAPTSLLWHDDRDESSLCST
jgi:hypothetical protein